MQLQRLVIAAAVAAGTLAARPALADAPQPLGDFKSWSAFASGAGDDKVCYVLSKPKLSEPSKVKRDAVYFLINDWPGRKAKSEPEIMPGYLFKDGSKVTAEVGPDKFEFFTKNEGTSGGAWIEQQSDESRLIEAMRRGAEIIVRGESKRGTKTQDTYSLAGLSDALDKAHGACGL
ncbi:MAG TPA: invasion associated locus B family protein [Rhizomicrobium sp.]|nr:invasion associated locus B family protein [Rhizomicrobium sp.]